MVDPVNGPSWSWVSSPFSLSEISIRRSGTQAMEHRILTTPDGTTPLPILNRALPLSGGHTIPTPRP